LPSFRAKKSFFDLQLADLAVHNPGLPPFVVPDGAPLDSFAAPEPASVAILGLAVAALLRARRRRLRIG
jgi:hypothetical protein